MAVAYRLAGLEEEVETNGQSVLSAQIETAAYVTALHQDVGTSVGEIHKRIDYLAMASAPPSGNPGRLGDAEIG